MNSRYKHGAICRDIVDSIRCGHLAPGSHIPTQRCLSITYGVHRMTVRRATDSLVQLGYIKRKGPKGFTVSSNSPKTRRTARINLISNGIYSNQFRYISHNCQELARRLGLELRTLRIFPGSEYLASDALQDPGALSVVVGSLAPRQNDLACVMKSVASTVVAVGVDLTRLEINSITTDDQIGMEIAVKHLRDFGHRHIVLVSSTSNSRSPVLRNQISSWEKVHKKYGVDQSRSRERIVSLEPSANSKLAFSAYDATKKLFSCRGVSRLQSSLCEKKCAGGFGLLSIL